MIDRGDNITGAKTTTNINTSGIPIDMESRTRFYKPRNYTTRTLVKQFGPMIAAKDMVHKYRERRPMANWTTIAVADAAGQTTIEVDDYSIFHNDVVCWVIRDGEILMQLLVQDTSIDATVTIVNFTGTTGSGGLPVATEVGDIVVVGSEAHAEGEAVPDAYSNISVDQEDYLMQIDRAVKQTDIEGAITHYDDREKKLVQDTMMAWVEENKKINMAMYLGSKTRETTTASARRYQFRGLIDRITENVDDYNGVGAGFTVQAMQENMRKVTDDTPADGIPVFVSGVNINTAISSWPDGSIRVDPSSEKWGIQVRIIQTQYGPVANVYDNTLTGRHGLADRGFLLNSAHMRQLYLPDLPLRAYHNITNTRDIHNRENAISGTYGLQMALNEAFAAIKGVN